MNVKHNHNFLDHFMYPHTSYGHIWMTAITTWKYLRPSSTTFQAKRTKKKKTNLILSPGYNAIAKGNWNIVIRLILNSNFCSFFSLISIDLRHLGWNDRWRFHFGKTNIFKMVFLYSNTIFQWPNSCKINLFLICFDVEIFGKIMLLNNVYKQYTRFQLLKN